MPPLTWGPEFSVGIAEIDEQHQTLLDLLNRLDEAKRTGKGSRVMGEILASLLDYTRGHFAAEEQHMAAAGYPGLSRHRRQHRQLVEKVERYQHQFLHEKRRITRDMVEFLQYWLTNHILGDDQAFGAYRTAAAAGAPVSAGEE